MKEHRVDELDQFPSLQALGQHLDELAAHDAQPQARLRRHAREFGRLWPSSLGRLTPAARYAAAVGLAIAVGGGGYAVPVTRAAVSDVYSSFSDWFSGNNDAAPGRAVGTGEDVPPWVTAQDGEKRVLAEAGGEKLVAIRQGDKLTFALAGFGMTGTVAEYRETLAGQKIVLIGAGRFVANGRHDRRPIFGLVTAAIARIQFNYADNRSPILANAPTGAFGVVVDTNRRPSSITGYDQSGELVAHLPLVTQPQDLAPGQTLGDFRYCPDAASASGGCPPWER